MPQRTRSQKEQATARRLREVQESTLVKSQFEFSLGEAEVSLPTHEIEKKPDKSPQFADTSLLVRDLTKTLLFAAGIFSLELVVYFLWFK